MGEVARLKPEWDKHGVKPIALSVDSVASHKGWETDIDETQGQAVNYPILADVDRKVAKLYEMIHPQSDPILTVRAVYVVIPTRKFV